MQTSSQLDLTYYQNLLASDPCKADVAMVDLIASQYNNDVYQMFDASPDVLKPLYHEIKDAATKVRLAVRAKNDTKIYDPKAKETSTYADLVDRYGVEQADIMLTSKKPYPKDVYKQLMGFDKLSKRSETPAPSVTAPVVVEVNTAPSIISTKLIDPKNDFYIHITRGMTTKYFYTFGSLDVYIFLWKRIVREGWKDVGVYKLKQNFFDKGMLVCSFTREDLAKEVGCSVKVLRKILKDLVTSGAIAMDYIRLPHGLKQSVFILGYHKDKKEIYYINEV
jgi:hypothetical protein